MKKFKIYSFLAIIIPIIILGSSESFANKELPENIILSAANNLFSDVVKNKELYEDDITSFYTRVDDILTPIIDFDIIIKSIIGKKYYQEARGSYELNYSQQELDCFNARLSRIHYLIDQHQAVEAKRSFLDVGCGEGFAAKRRAGSVVGRGPRDSELPCCDRARISSHPHGGGRSADSGADCFLYRSVTP